jgi:hypothetical protein
MPLQFDFITDEQFRATLEADYNEMVTCSEAGAWKAVHVLAGSIIESVLVEYLAASGATSGDPLKMTFAELIDAGRKAGVLTPKSAELSRALKTYRNLIHPGRAKRLGEVADEDGATVAQALVSMIVRDVAATQAANYGLTADQVANKFESDPSALGIARHLLRDAPEKELVRLLTKVLPDRCLAEPYDSATVENHARLYREAFESAPTAVKRKAMARYVKVLKEEAATLVQIYEEEFFRAADLEYVAAGDRAMVRTHLLARLKEDLNAELLRAAEGIGQFLAEGDVDSFVDPLIRASAGGGQYAAAARGLLEGEATATPSGLDPHIVDRLTAWLDTYEENSLHARAAIVREIRSVYESWISAPSS